MSISKKSGGLKIVGYAFPDGKKRIGRAAGSAQNNVVGIPIRQSARGSERVCSPRIGRRKTSRWNRARFNGRAARGFQGNSKRIGAAVLAHANRKTRSDLIPA